MRLFAAVDLPEKIRQALSGCAQDIPGVKWLPPAQLHLTLAFIGEVDDISAKRIQTALELVKSPVFSLSLQGGGCFPNPARARVLWAGLAQSTALQGLAGQVAESLKNCGVELELRAFRPHVTLARIKQPVPDRVEAFLKAFQHIEVPPFEVKEFLLFLSQLHSTGAVHLPLKRYPLTEP